MVCSSKPYRCIHLPSSERPNSVLMAGLNRYSRWNKVLEYPPVRVPVRVRERPQESARTPAAMPWAEPLPLCKVGRRRVTPVARSTFPSAPLPNRTCGFHRIRLSSGLYLLLRITSPVMDVHVTRPAHHEGYAFPRRHDLYPFGLFPLAFHV